MNTEYLIMDDAQSLMKWSKRSESVPTLNEKQAGILIDQLAAHDSELMVDESGKLYFKEGDKDLLEIGIDDLSIMFKEAYFHFGEFFKQMAVGTGVGLRYDLDFLILRLDWGIGLHVPYETTKSGFYNVDKFSRHQTLHFAIGYPF